MPSLPTELDFTANPAATPARMDQAMGYLVAWLRRVESVQPDFLRAIDQLKSIGLDRLNEVLSPIFLDAQAIIAEISAARDDVTSGGAFAALTTDVANAVAAVAAVAAAVTALDAASVHRTGDENIAGTKNFTGAIQLAGTTLDPAAYARLTDNQSIDGIKTFAKKIVASLGIRINGQDLTGLTAAGKALIEAVDTDAQKALLGVGVEEVGGIGALVIAASTSLSVTAAIAFGTTVAGSTLTTSTYNGARSLGGFPGSGGSPSPQVQTGYEASLGLSGTWRLQTTMQGGNSNRPVGLWKRIA